MSRRNEQNPVQLGQTLRKLREEKDLSRELVAEQTGIGLRHLAAIELGEKNPSVNTLLRLVRGIGASPDRIFYPELFVKNTELEEAMRLLTRCSTNQRKLILAVIRMLLNQHDFHIE